MVGVVVLMIMLVVVDVIIRGGIGVQHRHDVIIRDTNALTVTRHAKRVTLVMGKPAMVCLEGAELMCRRVGLDGWTLEKEGVVKIEIDNQTSVAVPCITV
jgi:hypothetical protein